MEENNMNEIYHHGVQGQRWGFRRYQNKDGSLTPAGKRRAEKLKAKYTELTGKRMRRNPTKTKESKTKDESKKEEKSYKDLTNEELKKLTNRMNLEKNYLDSVRNLEKATPKQISRGKRYMKSLSNDVAKPAFKEAGKELFTKWLKKVGSDVLDLNPKETKDALSALKKEVEKTDLEKKNAENKKLTKQYQDELASMLNNSKLESTPESKPESKIETKPKSESKPKSNTKPRPEIEGQMYIDDLFKRKKKNK